MKAIPLLIDVIHLLQEGPHDKWPIRGVAEYKHHADDNSFETTEVSKQIQGRIHLPLVKHSII